MSCPMCQTVAQMRDDFETAKHGLDPALVDRVMKGLFIPNGGADDARALELLQAWARYHPHYQHQLAH